MNVSIPAVVRDLGTTVSGVQGAIAVEALVSAAFILIGGKTGDLIGRKLAYVLGLLGYAAGAIAMTLARDLTAVIIFWAMIGGIGASLLLPAMQSLTHGNFAGDHQKRVYALDGRPRRSPPRSGTCSVELLAGEPEPVREEVVRIYTEARPLALQIALLVPLVAGLLGVGNAVRMRRLPDPKPSNESAVTGIL